MNQPPIRIKRQSCKHGGQHDVASDTDVCIECVISLCVLHVKAAISQVVRDGWRAIRRSNEHSPPFNRWRTHIGFCPKCAKKFGVVDIYWQPLGE